MKNKTNSFLFFILIFIFIYVKPSYCQENIDSTRIYYEAVWELKHYEISTKSKLSFFGKRYLESKKTNNYESALFNLQSLAQIHSDNGSIFESEYYTVEAIKILDDIRSEELNEKYRKRLYNHLGMLYRKINDYESALVYYNRSLKLNITSVDSISITNNMANIYSDLQEYDKAIEILKPVYKKVLLKDYIRGKWKVISNLGFNESKLNVSGALGKMKTALDQQIKDSLFDGLFSSYRHLAIYYSDRSNLDTSLIYVNKALEISKKIKSPSFHKEALYLKLRLSKETEVLKYLNLSDSMQSVSRQIENKYLNKKYDIAEEKGKTLEMRLLGESQKRTNIMLSLLLIIIVIITVFLILLQRNRNKQHTLAQIHKTERNLSKKVHDELGNDIFYLMNQLQTNPASLLEKEGLQILNGLNEIYVKARDISKKYTTINTDEGYHDELLSLLNSFGSDTIKIVTNEVTSNFWESVSKLKKEQLYRVLQELLTNMKKHSDATLVGVTFTKIKKQIIIKYVDNGKGATSEELSTKNGLGNVENRIEDIKGTIIFDTSPENGFKAEIRFIQ